MSENLTPQQILRLAAILLRKPSGRISVWLHNFSVVRAAGGSLRSALALASTPGPFVEYVGDIGAPMTAKQLEEWERAGESMRQEAELEAALDTLVDTLEKSYPPKRLNIYPKDLNVRALADIRALERDYREYLSRLTAEAIRDRAVTFALHWRPVFDLWKGRARSDQEIDAAVSEHLRCHERLRTLPDATIYHRWLKGRGRWSDADAGGYRSWRSTVRQTQLAPKEARQGLIARAAEWRKWRDEQRDNVAWALEAFLKTWEPRQLTSEELARVAEFKRWSAERSKQIVSNLRAGRPERLPASPTNR